MNSLQKNSEKSGQDELNAFFQSFEIKLNQASLDEVELTNKKLKFLGLNYNPFFQDNNEECEQVLENLGLSLFFQNPYLATNILLRLLDKVEERLNILKQ